MSTEITRDVFEKQLGNESVAELRQLAESELKLKIPTRISREKLLSIMYDAYVGSSVAPEIGAAAEAASITPAILPDVEGATVIIRCYAAAGIHRGGRFWKSGKHYFKEGELSPELIWNVGRDPAFKVEIL